MNREVGPGPKGEWALESRKEGVISSVEAYIYHALCPPIQTGMYDQPRVARHEKENEIRCPEYTAERESPTYGRWSDEWASRRRSHPANNLLHDGPVHAVQTDHRDGRNNQKFGALMGQKRRLRAGGVFNTGEISRPAKHHPDGRAASKGYVRTIS